MFKIFYLNDMSKLFFMFILIISKSFFRQRFLSQIKRQDIPSKTVTHPKLLPTRPASKLDFFYNSFLLQVNLYLEFNFAEHTLIYGKEKQ